MSIAAQTCNEIRDPEFIENKDQDSCCNSCCQQLFPDNESDRIDCGAGCDNLCDNSTNFTICTDIGLSFFNGLPTTLGESLCCLSTFGVTELVSVDGATTCISLVTSSPTSSSVGENISKIDARLVIWVGSASILAVSITFLALVLVKSNETTRTRTINNSVQKFRKKNRKKETHFSKVQQKSSLYSNSQRNKKIRYHFEETSISPGTQIPTIIPVADTEKVISEDNTPSPHFYKNTYG
eukprot:snap_masked-scaffold_45-processed-gene-1.74-mRNA-1 protein AED:1.00 eAED:1.00 QI:0/-1/0/0/-1/1/1/0/238